MVDTQSCVDWKWFMVFVWAINQKVIAFHFIGMNWFYVVENMLYDTLYEEG